MPWGPLKSGFLSGKYSRANTGTVESSRGALVGAPSEADYDVIEVVQSVAAEVGATSAAVALAWVQSRPGVGSTLIGARSVEQLEANLAGLEVTLTAAQRAKLDEASAPTLNFPADNHRSLAPILQFNGATVDGQQHSLWPSLLASPVRY